MESTKQLTAILLISLFFISSASPIDLDCGTCGHHHTPVVKPPITLPPVVKPPVTLPPVVKPPVTLPPLVKPPVTLPPVGIPPVTKPPVTLPPVVGIPPVTLPPVVKPPVTLPHVGKPKIDLTLPPVTIPVITPPVITPPVITIPVITPPVIPLPIGPPPKGNLCSSAPKFKPIPHATCPIDTLKLGACVDHLGGLLHVEVDDPAVNKCCPVLSGLAELEAAACLCTTLKVNLSNLKIHLPVALQLLVTCGKTPPPGYTCSP